MRTKTILLFVFLLTGMAFSQQGGGKQITLYRILELLALPDQESVTLALEKDGYKNMGEGKYSKGTEVFSIIFSPEPSVYYLEESPSKLRQREIQAIATSEGFQGEKRGSNSWIMRKSGDTIIEVIGTNLFIRKFN